MAVTLNQRIIDLLMAGHPPDTIANILAIPPDQVRTAAQDLTTAPSGQSGGAFTSGTFSGDVAVGGKFGANGVTPAAKASAYTQTYSTTTRTVPVATAAAVATTAATNSSPYGFSQAQADALVATVNELVADSLANRKLINALIDDLQGVGVSG